jgi:hypothetical protein
VSGATLHWFLPTSGDSRSLVGAGQGVPGEVKGGLRETLSHGFREPSIDYLADVARTAEKIGFAGVLTPTGTFCEDAWLTTAAHAAGDVDAEGCPRRVGRAARGGRSGLRPVPRGACGTLETWTMLRGRRWR